jgi:hypothetical protein
LTFERHGGSFALSKRPVENGPLHTREAGDRAGGAKTDPRTKTGEAKAGNPTQQLLKKA